MSDDPRLQSKLLALVLPLAISICSPQRLSAQFANIVGTVSDPSGASVVGATVRATNTATGLEWQAKTGPQGDYSLGLLPPGVYLVEATAARFSPVSVGGIELSVNATRQIDLHRFSGNDDFFGRYSFNDSLSLLRAFYLNTFSRNRSRLQSASLSEIHRFTPELFNEARSGFVRSANISLGAADSFGGAEPISLNSAGDATLPGTDVFSLPFAESPNPPEKQNNDLFSFNDDVT
jgi:hypothetical protein